MFTPLIAAACWVCELSTFERALPILDSLMENFSANQIWLPELTVANLGIGGIT